MLIINNKLFHVLSKAELNITCITLTRKEFININILKQSYLLKQMSIFLFWISKAIKKGYNSENIA